MDTYIKVVPSMLQDELGGVGFVLTVIHIHLEFISLEEEGEMTQCDVCVCNLKDDES